MGRKSYYKNGKYIDITTNKEYPPPFKCCICGSIYNLTYHHYIEQQRCIRDLSSKKVVYPSTLTQEKIKQIQKLFPVCLRCHTDIHNLSDESFYKKYNIKREKFLFKG